MALWFSDAEDWVAVGVDEDGDVAAGRDGGMGTGEYG